MRNVTYQQRRCIVHFNKPIAERDFFDIECDTRKTELAGHVHSTKLKLNRTVQFPSNENEILNIKTLQTLVIFAAISNPVKG